MPGTVTVASKLPNGLILRIFEWREQPELVLGGGVRTERRASERVDAGRIIIHGTRTPHGQDPKALIVAGYALTPDVDADQFAAWLEQNKESDLVANKLIWAHAKNDAVNGTARENEKRRSGLEPMIPATDADPVGDARMPRSGVLRDQAA